MCPRPHLSKPENQLIIVERIFVVLHLFSGTMTICGLEVPGTDQLIRAANVVQRTRSTQGPQKKRLSNSTIRIGHELPRKEDVSTKEPVTHEETLVAIGTPVLALWTLEYYPAIVQQYSSEKSRYQVQYCDGVLRWMTRGKFAVTSDRDFCAVPVLPQLELRA